jgi:hypothetical protein
MGRILGILVAVIVLLVPVSSVTAESKCESECKQKCVQSLMACLDRCGSEFRPGTESEKRCNGSCDGRYGVDCFFGCETYCRDRF